LVSSSPSIKLDKPPVRIVAVQGAVQLASAVAAMWQSNRDRSWQHVENHLIVHDLSCPGEQGEAFAQSLFRLAELTEKWKSMHYLPLPKVLAFQSPMKDAGWTGATQAFQSFLGVEKVKEIFLGQNVLFLNNLIRQAYPDATRNCYGDGLGLNFSREYYTPSIAALPPWRRLGRRIEQWSRSKWQTVTQIAGRSSTSVGQIPYKSPLHAVPFDQKYLLLANHFDERLRHFRQLEAEDFRAIFSRFVSECQVSGSDGSEDLSASVRRAKEIVVLLTSNFSETKRMEQTAEVDGYLRMIRQRAIQAGSLLLIKPHPRDSYEKLDVLRKACTPFFDDIVAIAEPRSFYLPFESIFLRYLNAASQEGRVRVIATSSACISLEYLFGQPCELGFGDQIVESDFHPLWQKLRMRHERDLESLMNYCRSQQKPCHKVAA
jgi:hypothetical protein